MDMVRTGAFSLLVIRVWHFLAMAFFSSMCINLLAISGSAARFLAESGVCVYVVLFFSLIPLSHIFDADIEKDMNLDFRY